VRACPACGSERVRRAPLLLLAIVEPIVGRRRYQCGDCAWTGWKHRLRRRSDAPALPDRRISIRSAAWFVAAVLILIVLSSLLIISCERIELHKEFVAALKVA